MDHGAFNQWCRVEKVLCLFIRAETHDPLYTGPVIPTAVENGYLPRGREELCVTLEIHLAFLALCRGGQGEDTEYAGAYPFGCRLDGPTLAGAITVEGSYGLIDVEDNDISDGDDIDTWKIGGTWYVNKNLGFGLDFSRFDNFGIEEDTYGASAEWFVNEDIGLSLSYAHSEIDDTDVESDAVILGAELRF